MKLSRLFCVAVSVLIVGCSGSSIAEKKDGKPVKRVVLVNVGGVDAKLFDRVAAHIERNLYTKPRIAKPRDAVGSKELDEEMEALKDLVKPDVHCVIGIIMADEGVAHYMQSFPPERIGFVNATGTKPAEDDEEKYGRRVEKDAIAAIGLLSGLGECPMPRCALWHYPNDKGLDRKGRNLCPPDLRRWLLIHEKIGLEGEPDLSKPVLP
jgi:hypothetical protein